MSNSTRPPSPAPHSSAPERRFDLVTRQWVIVAGGRQDRPLEFRAPPDDPWSDSCAFCAGREHETTPTVASYPPPSASSDWPWQVRIVTNLYPAFVPELDPAAERSDACVEPSHGRHEVIIESPDHRRRLTELDRGEVEVVFFAYRDRYRETRREAKFRYAFLFKNSGRDAGMSREHLHSQFVALPEVPPLARQEQHGAIRFFADREQCVFCFLQRQTLADRRRLLIETDQIVAFAPYAARVPYEVWVMPKLHQADFADANNLLLRETADTVQEIVRRLETHLGPTAYNYVLHSNPFDMPRQDHYHWHIEILPRTGRLAGLEWGTGLLINTVPPELAAAQLRSAAKA